LPFRVEPIGRHPRIARIVFPAGGRRRWQGLLVDAVCNAGTEQCEQGADEQYDLALLVRRRGDRFVQPRGETDRVDAGVDPCGVVIRKLGKPSQAARGVTGAQIVPAKVAETAGYSGAAPEALRLGVPEEPADDV